MALRGPYRRGPGYVAAAGGLLAALLLAEAAARLEGPRVCADAQSILLQAAPDVGWTFTPDLRITLEDCHGDAWSAPLATNAEGLADQPWPLEKRPGDVRVLLLGNHVVDGLGVAREDRLSVRIAHLADQVRGARLSVVNAAIPGYATANQLTWLEKRGLRYRPDVVVLVLDPARDLAANLQTPPVEVVERDLPPASGLLAASGALRWLARRPAVTTRPSVKIGEPPPLAGADTQARALARTRDLVARLAEVSRSAGASFGILVAPPCPSEQPTANICEALEGVAPCIDPTATFEGLRASADKPLELCLDPLGRWGRDGHFLASHALWDLFTRAGLWPRGVVRGHRL